MTQNVTSTFFSQFSSYLANNYSRPPPEEKEVIRNYGEKDQPTIRRLDSLARLIIKGDSQNCAAVCLIKNYWVFTANNAEAIRANLDAIILSLRKINLEGKTIKSVKAARDDLLKNYLKDFTQETAKGRRLQKDVKKFLGAIKKQVFSKDEVKSLLLKQHFFSNQEKLHAEMCLTSQLIEEMTSKHKTYQIALGISKLCCRLCASGLFAFQDCYPDIPIDYSEFN